MGVFENPLLAATGFALCLLVTIVTRKKCEGTTLVRPWLWLIIAFGTLALVESLISLGTRSLSNGPADVGIGWIAASRFVGAASLLLPVVSLLGAKRPQDKAWHLIVLSLWVVLALPAAESYLLRSGGAIQIHDARGWFLLILVLTGLVNYLPTKHWLACLLFAAAQVAMLAGYLPLLKSQVGNARSFPALAAILLCGAALMVRTGWNSREKEQEQGPDIRLEKWRQFCDAYGFLWGMRVAERVNTLSGEDTLRLEWRSVLQAGSAETEPGNPRNEKIRTTFDKNLRSHLNPFVSGDWLPDIAD